MQHDHQKNRLKKPKFVSFQKWGTPPAVKKNPEEVGPMKLALAPKQSEYTGLPDCWMSVELAEIII